MLRGITFNLLVVLVAPLAVASHWPQFRGPGGGGISEETGLPLEWRRDEEHPLEDAAARPGQFQPDRLARSRLRDLLLGLRIGPKGAGQRGRPETPPRLRRSQERQGPVDAGGRPRTAPISLTTGRASPCTATPATRPSRTTRACTPSSGRPERPRYSHAGEQKVASVLAARKFHLYGSAASPVLHGDLLIVNAFVETAEEYSRATYVALDKRTGREVWREKVGGEWSSPLLVRVGGEGRTRGRHASTGAVAGPRPADRQAAMGVQGDARACGTPVAHDGVVYFVGDDQGKAAIRAGGRGDVTSTHKLWESPGGTRISSPVYHDGHLYWPREDGGPGVLCGRPHRQDASTVSGSAMVAHCSHPRSWPTTASTTSAASTGTYVLPRVRSSRFWPITRSRTMTACSTARRR